MGSDCISSWSLLIFLLCMLHDFVAILRPRRDMTEKLLKATLNPNTHTLSLRLSALPSALFFVLSKLAL